MQCAVGWMGNGCQATPVITALSRPEVLTCGLLAQYCLKNKTLWGKKNNKSCPSLAQPSMQHFCYQGKDCCIARVWKCLHYKAFFLAHKEFIDMSFRCPCLQGTSLSGKRGLDARTHDHHSVTLCYQSAAPTLTKLTDPASWSLSKQLECKVGFAFRSEWQGLGLKWRPANLLVKTASRILLVAKKTA